MEKEIIGKVKPREPTREQIKEAFKKTIERWEKIVEDVSYYDDSECLLCGLFPGYVGSCNKDACPIGLYTKNSICENTPYWEFDGDRTAENALAELNFLRKVYIWWMENPPWLAKAQEKKEEKKEEWVDITSKVKLFMHQHISGNYDVHFSDPDDERERWFGWIEKDGELKIKITCKEKYILEYIEPNMGFIRILKKA